MRNSLLVLPVFMTLVGAGGAGGYSKLKRSPAPTVFAPISPRTLDASLTGVTYNDELTQKLYATTSTNKLIEIAPSDLSIGRSVNLHEDPFSPATGGGNLYVLSGHGAKIQRVLLSQMTVVGETEVDSPNAPGDWHGKGVRLAVDRPNNHRVVVATENKNGTTSLDLFVDLHHTDRVLTEGRENTGLWLSNNRVFATSRDDIAVVTGDAPGFSTRFNKPPMHYTVAPGAGQVVERGSGQLCTGNGSIFDLNSPLPFVVATFRYSDPILAFAYYRYSPRPRAYALTGSNGKTAKLISYDLLSSREIGEVEVKTPPFALKEMIVAGPNTVVVRTEKGLMAIDVPAGM